ncbi:MAG: hypothetical protein J6R83_01075, partial [Clostridia bacterium]|nr:hypothetical protein [Clostridia bacterium]
MKKLLLLILSILFVALSALGLIGCGHIHEYLTEEVIPPTCTDDGYTLHKCECGDEYQDTFTMATGHNFTNYVSNNNATCTTNATETATCSNDNCNEKHTRDIANSELGHSFVYYVSNNDATATEDGTETAICSREGCTEEHTRVDEGSALGSPSGPDVYMIDFVKNNDCDYQIVVPEDYLATMRLKHIQNGANELKRLIDEATNNTLQIVKDVNYAGGKFISLGNTSLVPATIDADLCKLTADGILLFSQEDNIFMLGGSDTAVHYAVYEFLERYFGYDAIEDVEIIDTNVRNLSIEEFKIIEEPDVMQRHLDGEHAGSLNYKYRMRNALRGYSAASGLFTYDQNGKPTETYVVRNQHNTLDYIPYNTYKDTHGAYWYATDENGTLKTVSSGGPGEVCFTAHGDADEYDAMTDAYFDIIKQTIIQRFVIAEYQKTGELWWKNSTWSNMSIGIEDYGITCSCHACTEKT